MDKRNCIKCDADITDVMGVMVFVCVPEMAPYESKTTNHHMCINCGANGGNRITPEKLKKMLYGKVNLNKSPGNEQFMSALNSMDGNDCETLKSILKNYIQCGIIKSDEYKLAEFLLYGR